MSGFILKLVTVRFQDSSLVRDSLDTLGRPIEIS
jgi:hypothetical protein